MRVIGVSFIPPFLILYLFLNKKIRTSHGKARWAQAKDIETQKFSITILFWDIIALLNPLLYFQPKKLIKAYKKFFNFGWHLATPMQDTNFSRGGILFRIFQRNGI